MSIKRRSRTSKDLNGAQIGKTAPDFRSAFAKRNTADPSLFYYENRHLTPTGNVVMADFLADVLDPLLARREHMK